MGVSGFQEDSHPVVGSLPAPKLGVKLISVKRSAHDSKRRRLNESYLEYAAATEGQRRLEKRRNKKGGSSPRRAEVDQDRG
jgi:hypothetical protein